MREQYTVVVNDAELRAEMARYGMTQLRLAQETGEKRATIGWLCRGARATERARDRIARVFGAEAAERIFAPPPGPVASVAVP